MQPGPRSLEGDYSKEDLQCESLILQSRWLSDQTLASLHLPSLYKLRKCVVPKKKLCLHSWLWRAKVEVVWCSYRALTFFFCRKLHTQHGFDETWTTEIKYICIYLTYKVGKGLQTGTSLDSCVYFTATLRLFHRTHKKVLATETLSYTKKRRLESVWAEIHNPLCFLW